MSEKQQMAIEVQGVSASGENSIMDESHLVNHGIIDPRMSFDSAVPLCAFCYSIPLVSSMV